MRPWWFVALVGCATEPDLDTAPDVDGPRARCSYVNPFSQDAECKEYLGSAWDEATARADCDAPVPGADPGLLELGVACDRSDLLGECVIDPLGSESSILVFSGDGAEGCGGLELGCTFAGGVFAPTDRCDEDIDVEPAGVFKPFEQICRDPVEGEAPGAGPNGQVCTWQAISASTEAGRRFQDYADCDVVRTQRPYWAAEVEADTAPNDPRLTDTDWRAEYDWATTQVQASACVCCHTELAPDGPSGWHLEAAPIWTDTLDDDGLAMLAGWVDSTAFGAFDAEDNNGFDRHTTGLPTNDVSRMVSFLEGELAHRGLTEADFAETPPFGGPLYDQLFYEPGPCGAGAGVEDGAIVWDGGAARYLYVLEPDARSPGVPPNLDLPDGTIWRLDVLPTADAVPSGVGYGATPAGSTQAFPASGAPTSLTSGQTYYLVVLRDIYQPIERCLFEAP